MNACLPQYILQDEYVWSLLFGFFPSGTVTIQGCVCVRLCVRCLGLRSSDVRLRFLPNTGQCRRPLGVGGGLKNRGSAVGVGGASVVLNQRLEQGSLSSLTGKRSPGSVARERIGTTTTTMMMMSKLKECL